MQGEKLDFVGLPPTDPDSAVRIRDGRSFFFARIVFSYRDIFGTRYEVRSTAKYGRVTSRTGTAVMGFEFRDTPIAETDWDIDTCNFARLRQYNGFRRIETCQKN
jgi:hypothetical protein